MANEVRVYDNACGGTVEDSPLAAAATTLNSAGLAALRAIDTTNHAVIVIDPDGDHGGAPFAKRVTAHTAGVGSATIEAAALWGTARDVPAGTPWIHGPIAEDVGYLKAFKQQISAGAGNISGLASTSMVAIDGTKLPYLTLALAVGQVVECKFQAQAYVASTTNFCGFDVEVDQPTSANVFAGAGSDFGVVGFTVDSSRAQVVFEARFVATEAGVHGFRPAYKLNAASPTLLFCNAASGADDTQILWSVELKGTPTA